MYNKVIQPQGTIAAVANQDAFVDLANGVQNLWLLVTLTATLTITVAATAILNGGDLAACVRIALVDGGTDRVRVEGLALQHIVNSYAPSAISTTRLTALAPGAYALKSAFPVYFSSPFAVAPEEASFLEKDPSNKLRAAVFQKSATPAQFLVTGGTATLGAVTMEVEQAFVPNKGTLPYYIPTMRDMTFPVVAAQSRQRNVIDAKLNMLRALLVTQETNLGLTSDIINRASVLGDNGILIGPATMSWDHIARDQELQYGGRVFPAAVATDFAVLSNSQVLFNFQQFGRLSKLLNPNAYTNLRIETDSQPSVLAGVTSSLIRVTLLEMERPQQAGQRKYVADLPPFLQG